jgi:serine/threonine protein kinase
MLSKLGKYKIIGELGKGAMGVVYRAQDPRLGRLVALKTTNAEVAGDPDLLQRFYREAQAAANLTHPNIVTIYDIDEANGVPFIAMEYLEGETLQKIIGDRREVPTLKKVQYVIDSCKGLGFAHQHGIVHRDVKPANIVVLTSGEVKIVDFGIARVGASSMTRSGVVMGTVMYMSPEQVQGMTTDNRSDVFSLGIVLYELLTYQLPFTGDDASAILVKIINEPAPPLSKYIQKCPPALEQIVQRALTKDREKRYQSAEDMAFDLQRVADSLKRDTIDVFLEQGQSSLQHGDLTIAKESLQKVLEIDSTHNLAKELLAKVRDSIQSQQRAEKVEFDLERAADALEAQQYEEALGWANEVLQMDPENELAKQYKQTAVEKSDRVAEIQRHLNRAEKFAAEKDLPKAKAELLALLKIEPDNSAALAMIDWVSRELADTERLRQVAEHLEIARGHLAKKNYEKALEALDRARDPGVVNVEVDALTVQVRAAREKEEKHKLLLQRVAEIEEALSKGKLDVAQKASDEAMREFEDEPQILKLHAQVVRLLEANKKRSYVDEQLQSARDLIEKDLFSSASALLQRAIQEVPDDARLTSYLKSVQESHEQHAREELRREAIRKANEQVHAKKFDEAIETVEKSLALAGQSPELVDLLQFVRDRQAEHQREEHTHRVLSRARTHLHDHQYDEAVQVLERGQQESKNSEIDALLADARHQREEFVKRRKEIVSNALAFLQSGEPAKAVALFEPAPKAYFKDEEFQRVFSQATQSLDRARFLHSAIEQTEKALAEEDLESAHAVLEQALTLYPTEAALLALQKRWKEEQTRLQRAERAKVLEEAKVAVGRMEYGDAVGLLQSVTWESSDSPEQAAQAKSLLEEAERRRREQTVPQVVRVPPKRLDTQKRGPAPEPAASKKPLIAVAAILVVAAIAFAVFWTRHGGGGSASGYIQLTAAPWGEVASVSNEKGEHLNITGETPLQVALPPGRYVIELKNGQSNCKVEASVERGAIAAYSCVFPEVKIDDLVQKVLSAY